MSVSKAHTRASAKYNAKTYKTFTVNARIADYEQITTVSNSCGMSKAGFLIAAAKYCIDNNIDLTTNQNTDIDKKP